MEEKWFKWWMVWAGACVVYLVLQFFLYVFSGKSLETILVRALDYFSNGSTLSTICCLLYTTALTVAMYWAGAQVVIKREPEDEQSGGGLWGDKKNPESIVRDWNDNSPNHAISVWKPIVYLHRYGGIKWLKELNKWTYNWTWFWVLVLIILLAYTSFWGAKFLDLVKNTTKAALPRSPIYLSVQLIMIVIVIRAAYYCYFKVSGIYQDYKDALVSLGARRIKDIKEPDVDPDKLPIDFHAIERNSLINEISGLDLGIYRCIIWNAIPFTIVQNIQKGMMMKKTPREKSAEMSAKDKREFIWITSTWTIVVALASFGIYCAINEYVLKEENFRADFPWAVTLFVLPFVIAPVFAASYYALYSDSIEFFCELQTVGETVAIIIMYILYAGKASFFGGAIPAGYLVAFLILIPCIVILIAKIPRPPQKYVPRPPPKQQQKGRRGKEAGPDLSAVCKFQPMRIGVLEEGQEIFEQGQ